MKKQILVAGTLLLSVIFPLKALAQNYNKIYVFGDSLSDTGNVFNATDEAIPPSPTYFNGRFADGPVWVEYLASELGLTLNPLDNFAFGGATTGTNNIGLPILPGLQQQVNSFVTANPSANENALYILWAGTNDYLEYFFGNVPNPTNATTNLSTAVTSLASVGAQNIMVVNLPDLGKFPVTGGNSQTASILSTLTNAHNSGLSTALDFLNQELNPEVNIIPLDVYSLFNRVIDAPEEFGFINVTNSCIGELSVVPIDVPITPVTCVPDKFLFWDEVHPTSATHKLIGQLAFSTLLPVSVPEPSIVLGVVFGALGAVSVRKRQRFSGFVKK